MAFIPVPNGVSLCFHFTQAGQNWQFCLTLQKNVGAPSTTDLENLATMGASWWGSDLRSQLSTEVTLTDCTATDLTAQGAPQRVVAGAGAGQQASSALPLSSSLVASLRTALRGRSYRGRLYLGGLVSAGSANSADYDGTHITAILGKISSLKTSIESAGFTWGIASRQHNKAVVNPAHFEPVEAVIMDSHFDSQRRRLFGRGK